MPPTLRRQFADRSSHQDRSRISKAMAAVKQRACLKQALQDRLRRHANAIRSPLRLACITYIDVRTSVDRAVRRGSVSCRAIFAVSALNSYSVLTISPIKRVRPERARVQLGESPTIHQLARPRRYDSTTTTTTRSSRRMHRLCIAAALRAPTTFGSILDLA